MIFVLSMVNECLVILSQVEEETTSSHNLKEKGRSRVMRLGKLVLPSPNCSGEEALNSSGRLVPSTNPFRKVSHLYLSKGCILGAIITSRIVRAVNPSIVSFRVTSPSKVF
jgi:hypothetical protein